jgi:L-threonylcarbamoyladenylate synthase
MAKVLPVAFEQPAPSSNPIEEIQSVLNSGGVIAFPTDTFYGLAADPFNPDAISKIFKIKQRPEDKPLLVLIHSLDQLADLTQEVTDHARKLMEHFWPGPLTLIFKAASGLPDTLTAGTGTIGIRLPGHPFTRRFLEALDRPLTAPSANISGAGEPKTVQELSSALTEGLDLVVDGGPTPGGKVSTILDTTTHPPTLIREGVLSRSDLESVLPIQ